MRCFGWLLLAGLATSAFSFSSANDEPLPPAAEVKKEAELKWAKGVAADFLDCVRTLDKPEAAQLMSADYKKEIAVSNLLEPWLQRAYDDGLRQKFTIAEEQLSPDQDEAVFKGVLAGDDRQADFTLRIVHEKDGGKWRVNLFRYKLREKGEGKK